MRRSEMKKMLSVILLATLLLALVACTVPEVAEEAQALEDSGEAPVAEGPVSAEIASTTGLDEALEQLELVE